jgi:hypothetical protein
VLARCAGQRGDVALRKSNGNMQIAVGQFSSVSMRKSKNLAGNAVFDFVGGERLNLLVRQA